MTERKSSIGYPNRQAKDALFKFLFGREENKRFALSLYNALNETNHTNPDDLEIVQLEDVLYLNYKNDVSFLLDHHLNMYEEQSTWNPNVPLRFLLYIAAEYSRLIDMFDWDLYSTHPQKIPVAKCIVLYNGKKNDPDQWELHLSDLFAVKEQGDVEVNTTVYNINAEKDSNLLKKCPVLKEYATVIHRTDQCMKQTGNKEKQSELIRQMIDELPDSFEIKPLLVREKDEVVSMLLTEFDAKKHDRHTYNDGKEDGLAEGKAEGLDEGLKAAVQMLKPFCKSFEELYQTVKSNPTYANVSEEEVRKYYFDK